MQIFDVEIKETYKCVAQIQAESESKAIDICKNLYEAGVLELDSEDISDTQFSIRE